MSETHSTISQFFAADHDRLDRLWVAWLLLQERDIVAAREQFQAFRQGLERHIRWEEELLFPRFEEKIGVHGQGPTAVMRHEHRQIRAILEAIGQALQQGRPAQEQDTQTLPRILAAHNQKEEHVLYPLLDEHIAPDELRAVFRQMGQDASSPLPKGCCGPGGH